MEDWLSRHGLGDAGIRAQLADWGVDSLDELEFVEGARCGSCCCRAG